jgi:hypothetical protein
MHSVDVLEEAIELAECAGFEVRREFLGESTGGACRIAGQWLLFVDLSLPAAEQLAQVVTALRTTGRVRPRADTSAALRGLLEGRRSPD